VVRSGNGAKARNAMVANLAGVANFTNGSHPSF
jgi:hypothetical protein